MKSYSLLKLFVILFFYVHGIVAQNENSELQQKNHLQKFFLVPLDDFNIKEFYDNSSSSSFAEFLQRMHNLKIEFPNDDSGVSSRTNYPVKNDNMTAIRECASCTCGIPNRRRIIGGNTVRINKYPWIAQLRYFGRFYCGGSLINDRYILTAAHCTKGFDKSHITVRLLQFDQSSRTGIERNVSDVIRPDSYSIQTLDNDISLIRLSEPVHVQNDMRPICLPFRGQSYSGRTATVAGWGATFQNGGPTNILHELEVPILSNDRCKRTVYKNRITSTMLCAGYLAGGKDACQGDSGGPLMVSNGIAYEQAGIVSWGYGCARRNSPGVYTRVTKFLKWIIYHTSDACYCKSG